MTATSMVCPDCGGDCDTILAALEAQFDDEALEPVRRMGHRTIRAGDLVKITGLGRARVPVASPKGPVLAPGFRVLGFRRDEIVVFGRKSQFRVDHVRTFPVDRIRK